MKNGEKIMGVKIDPDSKDDEMLKPGNRVRFEADVAARSTLECWAQNIQLIEDDTPPSGDSTT